MSEQYRLWRVDITRLTVRLPAEITDAEDALAELRGHGLELGIHVDFATGEVLTPPDIAVIWAAEDEPNDDRNMAQLEAMLENERDGGTRP